MNSITELARELVEEYRQLTGRAPTMQEYLQIRGQAMQEIQNGFATSMIPYTVSKPSCEQSLQQPSLSATIPNTAEKNSTARPIVNKENTVPKANLPDVKLETKKNQKETKKNSFFDIVDKLDA